MELNRGNRNDTAEFHAVRQVEILLGSLETKAVKDARPETFEQIHGHAVIQLDKGFFTAQTKSLCFPTNE